MSIQMEKTKEAMRRMAEANNLKIGGNIDVLQLRQYMKMACMAQPVQEGVSIIPETLEGVPVEQLLPSELQGNDIVFYIHGGGYVCGSAEESRGFGSQICKGTGLMTYTVTYRLAPEHPFPAAIDDCFAVYKALLEKHPGKKIALIGESAGGHMVLTLTKRIMNAGLQMPPSITAYSPAGDMTGRFDREPYRDSDLVIAPEVEELLREIFVRDNDPENPEISPTNMDFHGYPPIYMVADDGEVLVLDADYMYQRAKEHSVDITYDKYHDTFHAFATTGMGTPESAEVFEKTISFMKKNF